MKRTLLLFLLIFSLSSYAQKVSYHTITVEPYMRLSYDAFFKKLTIKSPDSNADHIHGFKFDWGYTYVLKIKSEKLKAPMEDASDTDYHLVKLVSKKKVPDNYQFKMRLEKDLFLGPGEQENNFVYINDSTYSYFNTIEIEIPKELHDEFIKVKVKGEIRTGEFRFLDEKRIRLQNLD